MAETTHSVLSGRSMSSYPISIGTALSLESIAVGANPVYDPDRVIPNDIKITDYQELWINISTLYRNILGSVSVAAQATIVPADMLITLEFETELIKEIIAKLTLDRVKVVYYYSHYKGLERKHPHAKVRHDTTPKQVKYTEDRDRIITEYLKRHKKEGEVIEFDLGIKPSIPTKVLIITHEAYDLLSASQFTSMDLLESHTGKLKDKSQWWSKLSNSKELMRMPFNQCTLQLFGDSQRFHPMEGKLRVAVIELANEREWTPITTKARLQYSFEHMKDKFSGLVLAQMLKE